MHVKNLLFVYVYYTYTKTVHVYIPEINRKGRLLLQMETIFNNCGAVVTKYFKVLLSTCNVSYSIANRRWSQKTSQLAQRLALVSRLLSGATSQFMVNKYFAELRSHLTHNKHDTVVFFIFRYKLYKKTLVTYAKT